MEEYYNLDICGVTKKVGRFEFICVKKPHGEVYRRNKKSGRHKRGDLIFSNNPSVDQHYFVNKWPHGVKETADGNEESEASEGTGEA